MLHEELWTLECQHYNICPLTSAQGGTRTFGQIMADLSHHMSRNNLFYIQ